MYFNFTDWSVAVFYKLYHFQVNVFDYSIIEIFFYLFHRIFIKVNFFNIMLLIYKILLLDYFLLRLILRYFDFILIFQFKIFLFEIIHINLNNKIITSDLKNFALFIFNGVIILIFSRLIIISFFKIKTFIMMFLWVLRRNQHWVNVNDFLDILNFILFRILCDAVEIRNLWTFFSFSFDFIRAIKSLSLFWAR